MKSVSGIAVVLAGLFTLVPGVSKGQEMAWYEMARTSTAGDGQEIPSLFRCDNNGLLVAGTVYNNVNVSFLRYHATDGTILWSQNLPPLSINGKEYRTSGPIISQIDRGGWWVWSTHYLYDVGQITEQRFIRYRISPDGQIMTRDTGFDAGIGLPDGTQILPPATPTGTYVPESVTISFIRGMTGVTDSLVVDLSGVVEGFRGHPKVVWTKSVKENTFILISDGLTFESALVSIDHAGGQVQVARFDDVPTDAVSALITREGSVVVLGRELSWGPRLAGEMVLLWPSTEGGSRRVRTGQDSPKNPQILGDLSTGEILVGAYSDQLGIIYRYSATGELTGRLPLYSAGFTNTMISPDDAIYLSWGNYYYGKIAGTGGLTSVDDSDDPADPWLQLDLSSTYSRD